MDHVQPASHINAEGSPKMPYETEADARAAADAIYSRSRQMLQPYRCWMNPPHWHLSSQWSVNDLKYAPREG